MTIFVVHETYEGPILFATSEEAAKRALIETVWVNGGTEIWVENEAERHGGHHEFLTEHYGENWEEAFMKADSEALENMGFYISTEEVWE